MRVFLGAAALSVMLAAAPTFAAQAAPAPQARRRRRRLPAPPVQRPFPTGTKYAFVNIQRIAAESAAGKTLAGKVQALNQQKVNELNEKNKALQAAQQKLEAGASVLSADGARRSCRRTSSGSRSTSSALPRTRSRTSRTCRRSSRTSSRCRLTPIIQEVANERGLHMLFSVVDSGLVWADPALDITTEVIQKFDAARRRHRGAEARGGGTGAHSPRLPRRGASTPAAPAPKPAN